LVFERKGPKDAEKRGFPLKTRATREESDGGEKRRINLLIVLEGPSQRKDNCGGGTFECNQYKDGWGRGIKRKRNQNQEANEETWRGGNWKTEVERKAKANVWREEKNVSAHASRTKRHPTSIGKYTMGKEAEQVQWWWNLATSSGPLKG